MQARTLEIYSHLGIADAAIDLGIEDLFVHLDDTQFTLLAFGHSETPDSSAALCADSTTLAIDLDATNKAALDRAAVPHPSMFLLPDGHIALAGVTLDEAAIARYAAERMCMMSPARAGGARK